MMKNSFIFWVIVIFIFSGCNSFAQELKFQEKEDGILLLENGSPRYFYKVRAMDSLNEFSRTNYIHPLYGPEGEILTEDFPEDHAHHHGIFWAWHQLYAHGERIADPWLNEGIEWEVSTTKTEVGDSIAKLSSEIFWIHSSTSEAVIKENLTIIFQRIEKDVFSLRFRIELTALVDGVALGGSEDEKGYGGFSPRLKLPEEVVFNSVQGNVEPENLPLKAGGWMNVFGEFDLNSNKVAGVVIMGEPKKLPSYQGWILRSANSMQNMAFPGKEPFSIQKSNPLVIRNQLLVHRGLSKEEIEKYYLEFQNAEASE